MALRNEQGAPANRKLLCTVMFHSKIYIEERGKVWILFLYDRDNDIFLLEYLKNKTYNTMWGVKYIVFYEGYIDNNIDILINAMIEHKLAEES